MKKGVNDPNQLDIFENRSGEIDKSIDGESQQKEKKKELGLLKEDFDIILKMCSEIKINLNHEFMNQTNTVKDFLQKPKPEYMGFVENFGEWTQRVASQKGQDMQQGYNVLYSILLSFLDVLKKSYKKNQSIIKDQTYMTTGKINLQKFEEYRQNVLVDQGEFANEKEHIQKNINMLYQEILEKGISKNYINPVGEKIDFWQRRVRLASLREKLCNVLDNKNRFDDDKTWRECRFKSEHNLNRFFGEFLNFLQKRLSSELLNSVNFWMSEKKLFDKVLYKVFSEFRYGLRYAISDKRGYKISEVFVNKFYKLMLPEVLKYQKKITEADKAMQNRDYDKALKAYNRAHQLKSLEKYPVNKIKEIEEILKAQ